MKPTLTIALPAYNEERAIESVLNALVKQHRDAFVLDRIVVYNDGSTDSTVRLVKDVQARAPEIHLVDDTTRHGKIHRMNQMFQDCTSDLLMILDADVGLSGDDFLNTFVAATVSDQKSVMFAAHQIPLRPDGIKAGIYYASFLLWDYIRFSVPKKDHVQNFYGAATIFRKRFLPHAHVPDEMHEKRTFLYLMAKRMGGFTYVDEAAIVYWPPHTTADFSTLRNRAFGSDRAALENLFGHEAENAEVIPWKYKSIGIAKFFCAHPFYALPALYLNMRVSRDTKAVQSTTQSSRIWEIVSSTKKPAGKARIIFSNYDDLKNPVYAGGGAVAIHEAAKRLVKDFDITVLTGNYPGAKDETLDGVRYVRIGLQSFAGRVGQFLYHFFLPWHVMTKKYDLWIEGFTPPISTSGTPLFTKKPVIGLVHMLSGKDMARKYRLPFQYVENAGLKLYRHFIVLTEHTALEIQMQNPLADIAIIGNGIHSPRSPNKPAAGAYVAYLGRIEVDQKGLDLLLAAYAKVREKLEIPLLIAGTGSKKEMSKLENLVGLHGLRDSVQLVGRVEGEKKSEFLQHAMVGVISSRYETFSLVALEMMSYGIPAVAFDIPGIAWAPDTALMRVPSFDTGALAGSLVKLVENDILRKNIAKNARAYAQTRDWDTVSKDYERYLARVLAHEKKYE
jgi:phosphatidyl-myo-inositol alpha-mannosyltransferase